jgi:Ca2+-transporting ATPase
MTSEMINEIDISTLIGLSEQEVVNKLAEEGYNELPSSKPRNGLYIALEVLREPMFLLLLACGAIYLVLGDVQEALILLSFVIIIIGITFFQERKTERALEALRDLSSPRALVIRGGQQKRIAGREVVSGDIVLLSEGDRVPADSVLLWAMNMSVDESLLTGESVPVRKVSWDSGMEISHPGGDDLPFVYSATLVSWAGRVAGECDRHPHEMGKIGKR